jgi:type II secretory pathway component PulF
MLGFSDYERYAEPSALAGETGLYMVLIGALLTLVLALVSCTGGFLASILFLVGSLALAIYVKSVSIALAGGLGFVLTMTVALLNADRSGRPGWVREAAGLSLLITAFTLAVIFGTVLVGLSGGISLVVFFAGVTVYVKLNRKTLLARELEVVSTLASLMDQHLPLASGLQAAASSASGKTRLTFRRIAHRLEKGLPLWQSMRDGWRMCPGWVVSMVREAETFGRLAGALRAARGRLAQELRSASVPRAISLIYPVFVILYVLFALQGIAIFVFPSFQEFLYDEGERSAIDWMVKYLLFAHNLYGPLMQVVVIVLISVVWSRLRARRADRPRIGSQLGDLLKWNLPIFRWLERKTALAQVADFLQLGLRSGASADRVIGGASELDVNLRYRRRLRKWHEMVLSGVSIPDAVRRARLEPVLAWAFEAPSGAGKVPEVLQTVARTQRAQRDHVAAICRSILAVGLVLLAALFVGGTAFGLVYILRHLIDLSTGGVF